MKMLQHFSRCRGSSIRYCCRVGKFSWSTSCLIYATTVMSVYRGICPHGAYGEVLDINDALCVGQMLISGQVGRNRNGSSNRAHWEWEKQEKQDIKDLKKNTA